MARASILYLLKLHFILLLFNAKMEARLFEAECGHSYDIPLLITVMFLTPSYPLNTLINEHLHTYSSVILLNGCPLTFFFWLHSKFAVETAVMLDNDDTSFCFRTNDLQGW